ncbi:MAG TPA: PadR family transcriptional regulator [Phototrophicaceae bacterium]|nr:PadR family transcriptional regulator [Phototrophicaceae bacterium]
MTIKYVILGFLSETPLTGYDLKKKFTDSEIFHWSGNNNQIYRALSELHAGQLVTIEVQYQENKPPRKIYTITEMGSAALQAWILSPPELPQFRNPLLVQLSWADQVEAHEVDHLLVKYEEDLQMHLMMLREKVRRETRTTKIPASLFRNRIAEHWLSFYELELDWVRKLRHELDMDGK